MIKNRKQIIIISWIAVLLWMVFIFNLSSQVREESNNLSKGVTEILIKTVEKVAPKAEFDLDRLNHIIRKNAHFFAYLVLGILVLNAMRRSGVDSVRWVLLICILYAVSDEVHQFFVPGRGPGVKDVLIDSAGAIAGIGMYKILSKVYRRRI
ncbi:VanZ family protein [Clostridiaceae bacterium 35-E11]